MAMSTEPSTEDPLDLLVAEQFHPQVGHTSETITLFCISMGCERASRCSDMSCSALAINSVSPVCWSLSMQDVTRNVPNRLLVSENPLSIQDQASTPAFTILKSEVQPTMTRIQKPQETMQSPTESSPPTSGCLPHSRELLASCPRLQPAYRVLPLRPT